MTPPTATPNKQQVLSDPTVKAVWPETLTLLHIMSDKPDARYLLVREARMWDTIFQRFLRYVRAYTASASRICPRLRALHVFLHLDVSASHAGALVRMVCPAP